MRFLFGFVFLMALAFSAACGDGDGGTTTPVAPALPAATKTPRVCTDLGDGNGTGIPELKGDVITTASCLQYVDQTVGTGKAPTSASVVTAHYTGWLTNGTKFDSSVDSGTPITLALNRFIAGWTEGVGSMKEGGKRRLIIPGDLGYGAPGSPPLIPPNATLIFDVELISVQ